MKSKILNTIKILNKDELINIILILIFSSIAILFEFLSIASIPLFFSAILDVETNHGLLNKIFLFIKNLFTTSDTGILIFIILIFFVKSTSLFFLNIFEFISYKRIRLRLSEKLIKKFIKPDFNSDIIESSATKMWKLEIINVFAGVIGHFVNLLRNIGYIISILVFFVFYSSPVVIYFIIGLFIIISIYFLMFSKQLKTSGKLLSLGGKEKKNSIQSIINGIKDINILKRFKYFINSFHTSNIKLEKYTQKNLIISSLPVFYLDFFGIVIIVLFFFFLTSQKIEPLEILISISILAYGGVRIIGLLKTCINNLNFYKKSIFVIEVLFDELAKKPEINRSLNLIRFNKNIKDEKILKIKNLNYNYGKGNNILKNINLEFEINKIYCLIGESGSGKSTFLDIILGIKNYDNGTISINCKESEVGYVPQECYLIEDTIKNNIAFGISRENINMENLVNAAKEAQIFDFINSLPDKFDTKIGTFGSNISVGQKQRIGIARTLYNNSKVLLLDEPTSALDQITAKKFIKTLKQLKNNRLIIITSHDTNFKENYDFILKVENNSIKQINI